MSNTNKEKEIKEMHPEVKLIKEFIEKINKMSHLKNFNLKNANQETKETLEEFIENTNDFIYERVSTNVDMSEINDLFRSYQSSTNSYRPQKLDNKEIVEIQKTLRELEKLINEVKQIDKGLAVIILQRIMYRYLGITIVHMRLNMNTIFTFNSIQDLMTSTMKDEIEYTSLFNRESVYINNLYDLLMTHTSIIKEKYVEEDKEFLLSTKGMIEDKNYEFHSQLIMQVNLNSIINLEGFLYFNTSENIYTRDRNEQKLLRKIKEISDLLFFNSKTAFAAKKLNIVDELDTIDFTNWFETYESLSDVIVDEIEESVLQYSKAISVPNFVTASITYFKKLLSERNMTNGTIKTNDDIITKILSDYIESIKDYTSVRTINDLFRRFTSLLKDPQLGDIFRYVKRDSGYSTKSSLEFNSLDSLSSRFYYYLFDKHDDKGVPHFFLNDIVFKIITIISIERLSEFYDYSYQLFDSYPLLLVENLVFLRDSCR